jgi:hypothetical protein
MEGKSCDSPQQSVSGSVWQRVRAGIGRWLAGGALSAAPRVVFVVHFPAEELLWPQVCSCQEAAERAARFLPTSWTRQAALYSPIGWQRQRLGRAVAGTEAGGGSVYLAYTHAWGEERTFYPQAFVSHQQATRRYPAGVVLERALLGIEEFAPARAYPADNEPLVPAIRRL